MTQRPLPLTAVVEVEREKLLHLMSLVKEECLPDYFLRLIGERG